jgi:hypothetical protein
MGLSKEDVKMQWILSLFLLVPIVQDSAPGKAISEIQLKEGHFKLSITVEDSSRGYGVPNTDVVFKMRRGFFVLGRKKTDITLTTNAQGQVIIRGLPAGKVKLAIYADKGNPQEYEPDLQPGPAGQVQLRSGRLSILIQWKLE